MTIPTDKERWEVELRQLREEIHQIRSEQQELAKAVEQLVRTFTSLSTHLGITAEPYKRKQASGHELPGFA
jgi:predicted  nucleic acid-binding Zn-ribbon protein